MLFQLNSIDYTRKIRQGTYTVNAFDQYTEWTDANYRTHRHVYRSQISGSFTMYFGNQTDFQAFLNDLEAAKIGEGLYHIGAMSNNTDTWHGALDVFLDFTPSRQQKIIGEAWYPELKVTIKER